MFYLAKALADIVLNQASIYIPAVGKVTILMLLRNLSVISCVLFILNSIEMKCAQTSFATVSRDVGWANVKVGLSIKLFKGGHMQ